MSSCRWYKIGNRPSALKQSAVGRGVEIDSPSEVCERIISLVGSRMHAFCFFLFGSKSDKQLCIVSQFDRRSKVCELGGTVGSSRHVPALILIGHSWCNAVLTGVGS